MIEQNKTAHGVVDEGHSGLDGMQNEDAEGIITQNQAKVQEHDESRIQIVVPVGKVYETEDGECLHIQFVESETSNKDLASTPKGFESSQRKPNPNDVSAVCIDLLSENQTTERKCTLNSLHHSRIIAELKKQQKVFIEQGIQTTSDLAINSPVQPIPQQNEQLKPTHNQNQSESEPNPQPITLQTTQQLQTQQCNQLFIAPPNHIDELKTVLITSSHAESAQIPLKQTLVDCLNKIYSQHDSSIKQTPYLNSLQPSLPQIRNRNITFQPLPQDLFNLQNQQTGIIPLQSLPQDNFTLQNRQLPLKNPSQSKQNPSSSKQNPSQSEQKPFTSKQKPSQSEQKPIEIQQEEDSVKFLQGKNEQDYENIILQLRSKIASLQRQYSLLILQNNPNNIQQSNQNPNNHSYDHVPKNTQTRSSADKLSICKTYQVSIHIQQQQKQQKILIANQQNQESERSLTSKQVEVSQGRSQRIKQFSSGDVSNLLAESQSELIDLRDLQGPQKSPINMNQLSQIPIVLSSTIPPQNSTQLISFRIPILQISQSNLATVKECYEELPYERLKTMMGLEFIVSKISFKEKHYPSSYSTDKELKLYGKRLLRLLFQQSPYNSNPPQQSHMTTLQNDLEYYKDQQHVIYYLKTIQNFVFVCYFNHTIYIGEYVTQGPMKQIVRQGYGIQIRDSKYIYQGDFFADKKHGNGFIQFTNKNSFIYSGSFLDGFMDGYGRSITFNRQIYLGDYKLGQRDGLGKLIYNQEKNVYYEGEFYDGFKHGKGFEVFDNGDSYKGTYSRDKFQGQGQYTWKNSTAYQGTFVQGSKHGPGLLVFANGQAFQKYYDHNKEINLEDDKKTIKSSRISAYSQNKLQQKTLIQQKSRHLRDTRSVSGQSLLSYKSKSNQKSHKLIKDKNKIDELLRQKQIQEDLKNLDKILKDPTQQNRVKKIFSVKKMDTRDKIIGKMYNTTQRPTMKISEKGQLDLIKLSKIGSQRKSLVNFDSEQKLQELRESTHNKRVQRTTNFSQF